jgi:hypothetical protein
MAMTPKEKAAFIAKYNNAMKDPKNRKSGEIITPGSVVRGVAKVAGKVAGKQAAKKISANVGKKLTAAEKAKVKEVKYVAKNAKPGSVQKMLDKLPLEEKRAYSEALRKSIPAKKKAAVYKKTSVDSPVRVKTKIMNSRGKIITIKEN